MKPKIWETQGPVDGRGFKRGGFPISDSGLVLPFFQQMKD